MKPTPAEILDFAGKLLPVLRELYQATQGDPKAAMRAIKAGVKFQRAEVDAAIRRKPRAGKK